MKLRFSKDSIRLRLSETETEQWKHAGMIEETVLISSESRFIYRLENTQSGSDIEARFADGLLLIAVPEAIAMQWLASGEEGIHSQQKGGPGLTISIERDLPCKHSE